MLISKWNIAHKHTWGRNHVFILISEKAFDQVPYPFVIKYLRRLDIDGTSLNILKSVPEKSTGSTMLWVKPETIHSKIQNEVKVPKFSALNCYGVCCFS